MKRFGQALTGLTLLSLVPLASAGGIYIGGGLYNASVDEKIDNVDFDDDDTTGALFLGCQVGRQQVRLEAVRRQSGLDRLLGNLV